MTLIYNTLNSSAVRSNLIETIAIVGIGVVTLIFVVGLFIWFVKLVIDFQ